MTAQGKARLEQELSDIESRKWPMQTHLMQEVAHCSNALDNTDLLTLQNDRELLFIRKRVLQKMLDGVLIIESDGSSDMVEIEPTVVLQQDAEEHETFRVVGSAEVDPEAGLISNVSPLGRVLPGHRVDEIINLETEDGLSGYRIVRIQSAA